MEFYDDEGNKIVDKLIKQFIKDTDVELETREKLRNYSSLVTKKKEEVNIYLIILSIIFVLKFIFLN